MAASCKTPWTSQSSLYSPTFDVTSKTGAPLKQNRSNSFPVNTMALQGVPLTAGGLIIPARHSPLGVQAAAQLAASQIFAAASPGSPEEGRRNKNYKTELCRPFEETGYCKYGDKCQFAHGSAELLNVPRHPKFKTEPCKNYHQTGYCPYGKRCHFVHSEEALFAHQNAVQMSSSPGQCPQMAMIAAPFSPVAHPVNPCPVAPPAVLSIQPAYTSSLGSAGESPVPSSAGSESPNSFSPGLGSYSSLDEDLFMPGPGPPMTFPLPNGFTDPKSCRFVFPTPSGGNFGSGACEDVDGLAAGLEDMFVPGNVLGNGGTTPSANSSRLNVFRRLTSSTS